MEGERYIDKRILIHLPRAVYDQNHDTHVDLCAKTILTTMEKAVRRFVVVPVLYHVLKL